MRPVGDGLAHQLGLGLERGEQDPHRGEEAVDHYQTGGDQDGAHPAVGDAGGGVPTIVGMFGWPAGSLVGQHGSVVWPGVGYSILPAQTPTTQWWPNWQEWIKDYAGEKIPARKPAKGIEAAPGSYVKIRI